MINSVKSKYIPQDSCHMSNYTLSKGNTHAKTLATCQTTLCQKEIHPPRLLPHVKLHSVKRKYTRPKTLPHVKLHSVKRKYTHQNSCHISNYTLSKVNTRPKTLATCQTTFCQKEIHTPGLLPHVKLHSIKRKYTPQDSCHMSNYILSKRNTHPMTLATYQTTLCQKEIHTPRLLSRVKLHSVKSKYSKTLPACQTTVFQK